MKRRLRGLIERASGGHTGNAPRLSTPTPPTISNSTPEEAGMATPQTQLDRYRPTRSAHPAKHPLPPIITPRSAIQRSALPQPPRSPGNPIVIQPQRRTFRLLQPAAPVTLAGRIRPAGLTYFVKARTICIPLARAGRFMTTDSPRILLCYALMCWESCATLPQRIERRSIGC